jgi:regulator of protease activity HflC (stomatin/prohibitin superfamily)
MFTLATLIGMGIILLTAVIGYWLFNKTTEQVEDETEVFILNMGLVKKRLTQPGLHWIPEKIFPWVQSINISKQIDFRTYRNIQVSDHYGTTVIVDLWVEFHISDPYKALFSVENWSEVLESLVIHSTGSILSSQKVEEIIRHRNELSEQLKQTMASETERWGITLSSAMIQNVSLLPEVSKQFFKSVAARIERTKALIEEEGRISVAQLEAQTHFKVAELNSLAKTQMPLEIGSAYGKLALNPKLLKSYQEYWDLIHLDPRKTVTFNGFTHSPISAVEASMAIDSILNP